VIILELGFYDFGAFQLIGDFMFLGDDGRMVLNCVLCVWVFPASDVCVHCGWLL
jgi:hypothetical protein